MDSKYSDLELAINTLVTEFHQAADNAASMNTTQFQTMIADKLPGFAKSVENEAGLTKVLDQMEVKSGDDISFQKFWTLIDKQAVQLFNATHTEKNTKCNCVLH